MYYFKTHCTVVLILLNSTVMCANWNLCSKNLLNNSLISYSVKSNESQQGCACEQKMCVKKCCALGYSAKRKKCVKTESDSQSDEFDVYIYENDSILVNTSKDYFGFAIGTMKCEFYQLDPINYVEDVFYIQGDGRLYLPNLSPSKFVDKNRYCVDKFVDVGLSAFVCFEEEPSAVVMAKKANSIGMLISIPFLFATLVVYALLPECNLHGKALMCYVFSLMMAYILLVTIQLHPHQFGEKECVVLGLTCWFFFMVSFFWMNVMCIDISWAFSGYRSFSGGRSAERKRFMLYSIYAWGVPIIFSIIVSTVNHTLSDHAAKWYYPDIGNGQCWLKGGLTTLLYFYGPLGILILANVCLFALTAWKIWQAEQDTAMLRKDDNKKHNYDNDRQRFNLYLKLLIAMGINWTTEIISWAVEWRHSSTPTEIWYLTDFCNALYGVFIFFVFVFKRNIWKMLQKRYYSFIGKPHLAHSMTHSMNSTRVTSASSAHDKHNIVESSNI